MAITAVCACGKRFSARDDYEGRRAICPACKREFIFQAHEVTDRPLLLKVK